MKNNLYFNPKYYEIAFSFRNIKAEVDLFEKAFGRFSKRRVRSVLELGSGTSPHMVELCKRGYRYFALDKNSTILNYAKKKAVSLKPQPKFYKRDLSKFKIPAKADFVYTALGSLYLHDTKEIEAHLASTARALKKGGLYLLDWSVQFDPWKDKKESWSTKSGKVSVLTSYSRKLLIPAEQIYEETIKLDVNDAGIKKRFIWKEAFREIYPQEFLLLAKLSGSFEFVGWWNNWDLLKPLSKATHVTRPICILRRL